MTDQLSIDSTEPLPNVLDLCAEQPESEGAMDKKLTTEVVVVIHSQVEGKEHVAFRVEMRPQQVADALARESYSGEIFATFIAKACKLFDLDFFDCTADVLFPHIVYDAQKTGLPEDLLKVRTGMFTADITDGELLLH